MMAEHPELSAQERAGKAFPVSWDQFHRDCRALTWRLNEVGPFQAVIAITRGGLVPAAIVARELGVRIIDTVCVASYDHTKQGDLKILKGISADTAKLGGGTGKGLLIVDDLVDTGKTARLVREHDARRAFRHRVCQADGTSAGRYLHHRGVAGHLDLLSLGHRAVVPAADPRRRGVTFLTSPRVRGEVGFYAQRKIRVRGPLSESVCVETPPHPGLRRASFSSRLRKRGEGELECRCKTASRRQAISSPPRIAACSPAIAASSTIQPPKPLTRRWTSKAWLTCVCEFRGRRRKVMGGRSWTELFFLDEATAFAAGHRPCFFCRRDDAKRFRAAWEAGNGVTGILARDMDAVLHRERLAGGNKRLHALPMSLEELPDGAMVQQETESYLIAQRQAWRWSPAGYRAGREHCVARRHAC